MRTYQAIIIGGGSAGLAAAITFKENGIDDIVVLEKDEEAGGILQQCIHNGFGLQTFHEQLSGPSYAERFIKQAKDLNITIKLNTMVTSLTKDRVVTYVNEKEGVVEVVGKTVVLAQGCYERPRGAINIMGSRCAGIYTAGQAQRYLNIDGYLVGKKVFILGSGDIGLIMARRMTLEGAKVYGVAEIMPYSNGLPRNMKQCLEDFNIPLYLSHTVVKVYGEDRLQKITICQVDEKMQPIPNTEKDFEVDTLLLSVGLIPENHLATEAGIEIDPRIRGPFVDERYMSKVKGIFACGNGLHVHDLVDFVTLQARRAAQGAVAYLKYGERSGKLLQVLPGKDIGYVVPGMIHEGTNENTEFFFRVRRPLNHVRIHIKSNDTIIKSIEKKKLVPSEMERVLLPGKVLETIHDNIVFEAEEVQ